MAQAAYKIEHIAKKPAGFRVRSVQRGAHVVRIGFPPGPRKKGAGKVLEILHPKAEKNASCIVSNQAKNNPSELLIFGNPAARRSGGGNPAHKGEGTFRFLGKKFKAKTAQEARRRAFRFQDLKGERAAKRTLREKANPRRRRKDRRNPSETEDAVRLFETFHGRDASEIIDKHVSTVHRKDYTALGNLEKLVVETPLGQTATFDFEGDGVMLASSPDGKQLYCIGGRQNLLPLLDEDSQQKDFIDLGECVQVEYLARKIHSNFEPTTWFHKFGEKTGARPQLMFDKLRKQIFFIGGEYFIDLKQAVSPGIEN